MWKLEVVAAPLNAIGHESVFWKIQTRFNNLVRITPTARDSIEAPRDQLVVTLECRGVLKADASDKSSVIAYSVPYIALFMSDRQRDIDPHYHLF